HRARAFAAEVKTERRSLPEHSEVAGILGVEDAFPVTQPCDHGAAGFLAEHVAVGQAKLAARLLDDLREPARDGAEEAVAGVDGRVRGIVRALRFRALRLRRWRRRSLVLRGLGRWGRCPWSIARRRRIGLGQKGRARQAEQNKGESDGPRHGAHRMLHETRVKLHRYQRRYLGFAAKPQPNRPMTGKTMAARRR